MSYFKVGVVLLLVIVGLNATESRHGFAKESKDPLTWFLEKL